MTYSDLSRKSLEAYYCTCSTFTAGNEVTPQAAQPSRGWVHDQGTSNVLIANLQYARRGSLIIGKVFTLHHLRTSTFDYDHCQ